MRALPRGLAPASRRQHAQAIARVMALAAYPARVIARSPIPRGFVPPQRSSKAKAYLYPSEDAALLACAEVPLGARILYGVLAREGMRAGEARALTWGDVDLERGSIRLDTNKTDDPRAWSLSVGVQQALLRWKTIVDSGRPDRRREFSESHYGTAADAAPSSPVFLLEETDWTHAAALLRGHLQTAGVGRAELFEASSARLRVRLHDLRGTFVTLALAAGRTETWVADRTGHKSSVMINAYRRSARTAAELRLGELAPLNEAIPELAPEVAPERAARRGSRVRRGRVDLGESRPGRAGGIGIRRRLKSALDRRVWAPVSENPADLEPSEAASQRGARVAAPSEAPAAFSENPRRDAVASLGPLLARCALAGDTAAARALERALRELLERSGEGAEVVDLATRRKG
jgi:integrase